MIQEIGGTRCLIRPNFDPQPLYVAAGKEWAHWAGLRLARMMAYRFTDPNAFQQINIELEQDYGRTRYSDLTVAALARWLAPDIVNHYYFVNHLDALYNPSWQSSPRENKPILVAVNYFCRIGCIPEDKNLFKVTLDLPYYENSYSFWRSEGRITGNHQDLSLFSLLGCNPLMLQGAVDELAKVYFGCYPILLNLSLVDDERIGRDLGKKLLRKFFDARKYAIASLTVEQKMAYWKELKPNESPKSVPENSEIVEAEGFLLP